MDMCDEASALTEARIESALASNRRRYAEVATVVAGTVCVDCGEPLTGLRVDLRAVRCIDCQRLYEQELEQSKYRGETQ